MKQWLDFWEKCKGKKGSPVLIGLLVGLLLLVITWPDNSSKKQNTQTKTNAPAVENNVRNTEDPEVPEEGSCSSSHSFWIPAG